MQKIENLAVAEDRAEKPLVKTKGIKAPERLPIGVYDTVTGRWYKGFEIKKMHSDALVKFANEPNHFRAFGAVVAQGLVRIFDLDTGEDMPDWRKVTSKIFFPDIFFLMTEIIVLSKGTTLVPTVYQCPRCKKFTRFEKPVGEESTENDGFDLLSSDNEFAAREMEDVRELEFVTIDLEIPEISFHFDEGVEIEGQFFTDYVFRIPTIGDYITKAGEDADVSGEKKVLFHCLESVSGVKGKDLIKLKTKYGLALLGFTLKDYMEIVGKLNSIGYRYDKHKVDCANCGYTFKTVFDLTNFFGGLLSR